MLAGLGHAADFNRVAVINIDSTADPLNDYYIGANPVALTFDGVNAYVAGYNNSTSAQDTAIAKVENLLGGNPTFVAIPDSLQAFTPAFRGYVNLDWSPDLNLLGAAFDSGSASFGAYTTYDASGNLVASIDGLRGGGGVAFDPGDDVDVDPLVTFPVLAAPIWGQGRLKGWDPLTGAEVYYTNGDNDEPRGPNIFAAGFGASEWRCLDFDPDGNVAARRNNQLVVGTRTLDMPVVNLDNGADIVPAFDPLLHVPYADGTFVSGSNCQILHGIDGMDPLVILNDRSTTAPGQSFTSVVKAVRLADGTEEPLSFFINGAPMEPTDVVGAGYYDFAWDADLQVLLILDFSNRDIHVFTPGSGDGCVGDLNGDGATDQSDLGILLASYQVDDGGDLNGDGQTDQQDLGILLADYNCVP
jgi:hypothetical protein